MNGFDGTVYERKPDGSIGPTIPGVKITFVNRDGSVTKTVTTTGSGRYRITLPPSRYVVTATHPDYEDFSSASAPDSFVLTGTGDGYQTRNIRMKKVPVDFLMITTSLLEKDSSFEETVSQYKSVLKATENLIAGYVELDSEECLNAYGVKVDDPKNWEEVQRVLEEIIGVTGASYVMILGGELVVPRPIVYACCNDKGKPVGVPSDAWYVDFDGDQIVDEGFSISRLPDLSYNSSAVVSDLQTAIMLHNAGGYTLDNEVHFSSMSDYTTPPYGVCNACTKKKEFFELMSTSDYIFFAGHGSPTHLYSGIGGKYSFPLIFSIGYMKYINLQTYHPVIVAYFPCEAGLLYPDKPTLAYEFMKAGAAAYVARTTKKGVGGCVADDFPDDIEGGMRIGDALFHAMRNTCLKFGDTSKASAGHICLYGDPTLRRH